MRNKTVEQKNDRLMAMAPGKLRIAAQSVSDPGLRAVFLRLASRVEARDSGFRPNPESISGFSGSKNSAPQCPAK